MRIRRYWKLGLLGVSAAVVAVAVAAQLLVGGGGPSSDDLGGSEPATQQHPAPGFAGLVDEMVVADSSPEPATEGNSGSPSLGVPAPGFAGLVDEMVVADLSPKATAEEMEKAERQTQPLFIEGEPVTPYAGHEVKSLEEPEQIKPTQVPDQPLEVLFATEDS